MEDERIREYDVVSCRIPRAMHRELAKKASEKMVTKSVVIRWALDLYLDHADKEAVEK